MYVGLLARDESCRNKIHDHNRQTHYAWTQPSDFRTEIIYTCKYPSIHVRLNPHVTETPSHTLTGCIFGSGCGDLIGMAGVLHARMSRASAYCSKSVQIPPSIPPTARSSIALPHSLIIWQAASTQKQEDQHDESIV